MRYLTLLMLVAALAACRKDDIVYLEEDIPVAPPVEQEVPIKGFYVLNEGNMGMNASTLDYYDYATGVYARNIYATANPDVPKELGDVGNALKIYGSRMYAVINCSNKVDIMDAATARRLGQIDIPNCRHIAFDGPYAYVTSYAGPVEINPDYTQKGFVAKIDTATMQVLDRCIVGFQPDGLAIADGKIYAANSGGYMTPNYENTLSVIDLATFAVERTIEIGINLDLVIADRNGHLWVTSRGDYFGTAARLYCYDLDAQRVVGSFETSAGAVWLDGDLLYTCGTTFSYDTYEENPSYQVYDTRTVALSNPCFAAQDVVDAIVKPYGVAVNPDNGQILLADAGNYVNPGRVYCLDRQGNRLWDIRAGDIPAHFAFLK